MGLQQFGHSEHRPDAHLLRRQPRDGDAAINPQGLQPAAFGHGTFHQHAGRCAVRKLTGVAGRDHAALDHRFEICEAFECRVRPVTLVTVEPHIPVSHGARGLVGHSHGRGDRHNLGVEQSLVLGHRGAALRFK